MKSRALNLAVLTGFLTALVVPFQLAAQQPRYKLINMGTLGGPNGYIEFTTRNLNSHGVVTGTGDTATGVNPPFCFDDCFLDHAYIWQNGVIRDLGGLPGVAISGSGPNDINANGVVAGIALTGGFYDVLGLPQFDGVVWKNGQIIDLGTFGGTFSYASTINNRDQVVGFALNTTPDSFDLGDFCGNFPEPTQMRAFIWNGGALQDLGTLGGTDSCALWVNQSGQVAGQSFTDSTPNASTGLPTLHPFFWDGKSMRDLGSLGGTLSFVSQFSIGLNDRGQVVGASTLAGDAVQHPFLWSGDALIDLGTLGGDNGEATSINNAGQIVGDAELLPGSHAHDAFLWQHGVMTDLGTLGRTSRALAINATGQVVGHSLMNDGTFHAFFWENGGPMVDLNSFVPPNSELTLTDAISINDRGEIAVQAALPNGDQQAILLIPCQDGEADCQAATTGANAAIHSNSAFTKGPTALAQRRKHLARR